MPVRRPPLRKMQDSWASNLVCESHSQRPKVAICLAGAARTLEQPLIFHSIRTNLIEAFGGDVTVFAAVKIPDWVGDTPTSADRERQIFRARTALAHLGAMGKRLILTNESQVPSSISPPVCQSSRAKDRDKVLFASLVAQLNNRAACHRLISEYEARQGQQFQYVIYTRPDMAWPTAMRPYCFWDRTRVLRQRDYVYMMPRAAATHYLHSVPANFFNCHTPWHGQLPETYELFHETDDRAGLITAKLARQRVFYKSRWVDIERSLVDGSFAGVTRNRSGSYHASLQLSGGRVVEVPGSFPAGEIAAAERFIFQQDLERQSLRKQVRRHHTR